MNEQIRRRAKYIALVAAGILAGSASVVRDRPGIRRRQHDGRLPREGHRHPAGDRQTGRPELPADFELPAEHEIQPPQRIRATGRPHKRYEFRY